MAHARRYSVVEGLTKEVSRFAIYGSSDVYLVIMPRARPVSYFEI